VLAAGGGCGVWSKLLLTDALMPKEESKFSWTALVYW